MKPTRYGLFAWLPNGVAAVKQEQRQKAGCRLAGCTMLQRTLVP